MLSLMVTVAHAAETAHQATESTGGIASLGLDARALIFQIINFALLAFILYKIAYKPIMRMLEERRQTIDESLKTAEAIAQTKEQMGQEQKAILAEANKRAEAILHESRQEAGQIIAEAESQAQVRAERITQEFEAKMQHSLERARQEIRNETIQLVTLAAEQVISEKLSPERDGAIVKQAIAQAEQSLKAEGNS